MRIIISETSSYKHKTVPLLLFYFGPFSIALLFYLHWLAPDILWGDSAKFPYKVYCGLSSIAKEALVGVHPLYIAIASIPSFLPVGNFPFRINLVSAVFGALTVANIFVFVRNVTRSWKASAIAALSLLVSHTFWTHSVITEVYTMYAFFLSLVLLMISLYCLKREKRYLYLGFWIAGLNISVHMFASLDLLCFLGFAVMLLIRKELLLKDIIIMVSLVLIGSSLYEYLMVKMFLDTKSIWEPLKSALVGGHPAKVLNVSFNLFEQIKKTTLYLGLNFPSPNILLTVLPLWSLLRRKSNHMSLPFLLFCLLFLNLLFAFRYTVPDQYAFFFPTYIIIAILIGLGADLILIHFSKRAILFTILLFFSLLPIGIYYEVPSLLRNNNIDVNFPRDVPYRDNYIYFLWPSKRGYTGARLYGEEVFSQAETHSVILADYTLYTVLKYLQIVEHRRNDVMVKWTEELDSSEIKSVLRQGKKVYLADNDKGYYPDWIFREYKVVKSGIIFEVEK